MGFALSYAKEPRRARHSSIHICRAAADAAFAHDPLHATLAGHLALTTKRYMHPRTAIGLAAVLMHLADLALQTRIFDRSGAGSAQLPGVVPGHTDIVQPAHHSDRVRAFTVLDEGEDFALRAEVKAMAFFKRSCSICSRACSFLSLRSSFNSAATCGSSFTALVTMLPSRACLRQRDNMKGWM